ELGLADTQAALVENGLRDRVRVRVDGGFMTGRDVIMAALLGADEYSFGTASMIAEGCIMLRSCHKDTCTTGIATQRKNLRAKFAGTPEGVAAYLLFVAEECRSLLASLGLRSLDDAIGRVECLRQRHTGGAALGGASALEWGERAPRGTAIARFEGSAGQSFGAFLTHGIELDLVGEANDYVGKAMSGGRIVIRPPAGDAGDPVLAGNT